MESNNKQACHYCRREIKGRTDKKFCNDSCRNAFHNETHRQQNNIMRTITNSLRRNRKIIRELLGDNNTTSVHKEQLLNNGFQKAYHTEVLVNRKGSRIYFCFEYGYQAMPDNTIRLFHKTN